MQRRVLAAKTTILGMIKSWELWLDPLEVTMISWERKLQQPQKNKQKPPTNHQKKPHKTHKQTKQQPNQKPPQKNPNNKKTPNPNPKAENRITKPGRFSSCLLTYCIVFSYILMYCIVFSYIVLKLYLLPMIMTRGILGHLLKIIYLF